MHVSTVSGRIPLYTQNLISLVRYLAAQTVGRDTKPLDIAISVAVGEPFQPLTYIDSINTSFSLLSPSAWAANPSNQGGSTMILDDMIILEKASRNA